jgi:putative peptidoglycan lipid II flippase
VAGWLEFLLLKRSLDRRIGRVPVGGGAAARAWLAALAAAAAAFALHHYAPIRQPVVSGVVVLGVYGALYLGLARALGLPEARQIVARMLRR